MTAPTLGDLLYLASYVIRVRVESLATAPDTPNQYTADLHVMGDQGAMSLDPLAGPPGPGGKQQFALRMQDNADVNTSADLPTGLTDTPEDIGKYWLIDTVDTEGVVTKETAWVWYGTEGWRQFQMGVVGPPGPVPLIQLSEQLIQPGTDSWIDTTGSSIEPSWQFNLAQPFGPHGPISPLWGFPDIDTATPAVADDLLAATDTHTSGGDTIWAPEALADLRINFYSLPEADFGSYSGVAQQANVASWTIPAQTFDWTPIVWGHLGGTQLNPMVTSNSQQLLNVSALGGTFTLTVLGHTTLAIPYNAAPPAIVSAIEALPSVGVGNVIGSLQGSMNTLLEFVNTLGAQAIADITTNPAALIPDIANAVVDVIDSGGNLINQVANMLTGDPLMIGAQVLLGEATTGTMIARGLGNTMGRIAIMPHYSTTNKTLAVTPKNQYAMIPAGQTASLFCNLWNDGKLGTYNFNPAGAQLFCMAVPVNLGG